MKNKNLEELIKELASTTKIEGRVFFNRIKEAKQMMLIEHIRTMKKQKTQ